MKPNQASAHIPEVPPAPPPTHTPPLPYSKSPGSYPPSEPNPRQTNKCSGRIGPTPSLTARSDQLRWSLPRDGNPIGSMHYPSKPLDVFSVQSDSSVGRAPRGGGRDASVSLRQSYGLFPPLFSTPPWFPACKTDVQRTGTQASCAPVTAISILP